MKSKNDPVDSYSTEVSELPISGRDILELMNEVLSRGAVFRFHAKGWSMAPFIRDGDIISIAPLDQKAPKLGEIMAVMFPDTDHLVVHRVVGKQEDTFLVQGDNLSNHADGFFPESAFLGRVVRVERGGRPVRFGLGVERILIAVCSRSGILQLFRNIKYFIQK